MKHRRGRSVVVESLADFDRRLSRGTTTLRGWRLRGLDLRERSAQLHRLTLSGTTFLGCRFAPGDEDVVQAGGALVLPALPQSPVDVYRTALYSPDELYDTVPGGAYADSLDARAYAWSQTGGPGGGAGNGDPTATLARSLHDHAVDEALAAWLATEEARGGKVVGVMGGHALRRGEEAYVAAARLGHQLAGQGLVVATGGGPGAMEAANLGAWLGRQPPEALDAAIEELAAVPTFRPSIQAWAESALAVRAVYPDGAANLGVPTWHYGHEPPNVFGSVIAKFFRNSLREATLLQVCDAGIVFLRGAGGTVQEVFQDACENFYADESSVAPMVLVGERYWTEELPVWPLLRALAADRAMAPHVHLVDRVEDVVEVLG